MVDAIIKTYGFVQIVLVIPKKKLNGADQIRLENQKKKLTENIEYTMLSIIQQFFKELANSNSLSPLISLKVNHLNWGYFK